ncbi:hypothetical protein K7W42_00530 [Deinococcus sp. HMF7604]|uniref:hypothetical protein n=1 Tax=Deinococcus betulae TaxID=2873312 RepID=UPI001CCB1B5C|nr:hypothetical protein [Deinococcus betulae]MBZ9749339.1 hypothetical protein [Deinococcus betulae]
MLTACGEAATEVPVNAAPQAALSAAALPSCPSRCDRGPSYRAALEELNRVREYMPNSGVIIVPDGGTVNLEAGAMGRLSQTLLDQLRRGLAEGFWDSPGSEQARGQGLSLLTGFLLKAQARIVNDQPYIVVLPSQVNELYTALSTLK